MSTDNTTNATEVGSHVADPSHSLSTSPLPRQPEPVERLAYSMREAADLIGVSYITMHRLLQRGLIKSSGALRTKIIAKSELERFLNC